MLKRLWLGICGSALLGMGLPAQAVVVELLPDDQIAQTADAVTLELVISGLGDFAPDSLGAFDIDIAFDDAVLGLTGVTLGEFLGDFGLGEAIDVGFGEFAAGLLNLAVVSLLEPDGATCVFCIAPYLDDIQPGSFTLATLEFDVLDLEPGSATTVSIDTIYALGDGFGDPLGLDDVGDATLRNPRIGVPEPGALVLLALGLLATTGLRMRRADRRLR